MSPGEYKELTAFFIDHVGRHQQETRAFVGEQLGRHQRETRAFVGVSVEALGHEIRLVADGVLTNRLLIEANGARIDTLAERVEQLDIRMTARLEDHEVRLRVLE
jgi:hypothetical protein